MMNEQRPHPVIRVVLLPKDTNRHGTIFGGTILSYLDLAGAAQVQKHTAQKVVTVSMNEVAFKAPVYVGEVVSFYGDTKKIGNTSITVHIDVEVQRDGELIPVTHADLTFVAIDESGKPTPIKELSQKPLLL